jgi:hypothetical protein
MRWIQIDWRTYVSCDWQVAVALHFNQRDWFITTVHGGEVTSDFCSAEEAMNYADQLFQGAVS